jgi:hypothetical protein
MRPTRRKLLAFGGNAPFSTVFGHRKYLAENKAYFRQFPLKITYFQRFRWPAKIMLFRHLFLAAMNFGGKMASTFGGNYVVAKSSLALFLAIFS